MKKVIVAAMPIVFTMWFAGCNLQPSPVAVRSAGAESVTVGIALTEDMSLQIASATITVTAQDMQRIQTALKIGGAMLTGKIDNVPVGEKRLFSVAAYDKNNKVLYTGSALATISAGEIAKISIILKKEMGAAVIEATVGESVDTTDKTPPSVVLVGDSIIQIEVGTKFVDPGAVAYDLGDSKNIPVTVSGTVDETKAGTYTLVYAAKDSKGNAISIRRTVIVLPVQGGDHIPPAITLLGPDTIALEQGQTIEQFKARYVEPGYAAIDDRDGNITKNVKVSPITYQNDAVYYIQYDVKDAAGNAAETMYRYIKTGVSIIESYPPVIILVYGDSVLQIIRGTKWVEPGFAITDVQDKTIPNSKVIVDSSDLIKNLNTLGNYVVTYTVSNSLGLSTIKERHVQVILSANDRYPPVITLLGRNPDTVLIQSGNYEEPGYTATDDLDGDVTAGVVRTGSVDVLRLGKNTLVYTASDSHGNRATAMRTVLVVPDTIITDFFIRYAVPTSNPLPTIFGKYVVKAIDGAMIDLSNIRSLEMMWDASNRVLESMNINLVNNPHVVSLTSGSVMSQTFDAQSGAKMELSNTGVTGLDGKYYVTVINGQFIWVERSKRFAILWEKTE